LNVSEAVTSRLTVYLRKTSETYSLQFEKVSTECMYNEGQKINTRPWRRYKLLLHGDKRPELNSLFNKTTPKSVLESHYNSKH
jgi:hypothetical protein